jgi:hypothetical protein
VENVEHNPKFQSLLAQADRHLSLHRPEEYAQLKKSGELKAVLLDRTKACWEVLEDCRKKGLALDQAHEIALPIILVKDEATEEEEETEAAEEIEAWKRLGRGSLI